jgi:hypothetical protein
LVQGSLDALPWQDGAVDKCLRHGHSRASGASY